MRVQQFTTRVANWLNGAGQLGKFGRTRTVSESGNQDFPIVRKSHRDDKVAGFEAGID